MPKTNADGTTSNRFQIDHDQDGPALKNEGGALAARNAADSNYAIQRGANPVGPSDLVNKVGHPALLQLIHFIKEGPGEGFASGATKTITGTVFPTEVLWKRADATNLVKRTITWTGVNATTDQWEMYDTDGTTVLATVTDTIAYSGVYETGRTRALT